MVQISEVQYLKMYIYSILQLKAVNIKPPVCVRDNFWASDEAQSLLY